MNQTLFPLTWKYLQSPDKEESNPYIKECKIPIGSKRPYYEYQDEIPEEEIVYIHFDSITKQTTERKPFNGLIIGGAGDGKSQLLKLIWFFLHKSGYYCLYIDPKGTESGRARIATTIGINRLPPQIKPEGIALKHFMPTFATRNFEHMVHNFKQYSIRLHNITGKEMWRGLGCTDLASLKIDEIVKEFGAEITTKNLIQQVEMMYQDKKVNSQSFTSMYSIISDLNYHLINEKFTELDLLTEFQQGNSVCISYNSCSFTWLSFDVGLKIYQCARFFHDRNNRVPIMFFLDDSSHYAVHKKEILKYNLAIEEIINIGFVYRSVGLYNWMSVQTLSIIDNRVAETYRIKIITPSFNNPDSLHAINVPKRAIEILKNRELKIDKERHIMQYLLVREDNTVQKFYPFLPPSNHFKEVYHDKDHASR